MLKSSSTRSSSSHDDEHTTTTTLQQQQQDRLTAGTNGVEDRVGKGRAGRASTLIVIGVAAQRVNHVRPARSLPAQQHELFRLFNGEHLQHHGINQAEDCVFAPMPKARDSTATAVKPRLRASSRNPYRKSCPSDSRPDSHPTLRTSSFTASMLPISTRAARRASSSFIPERTFSSTAAPT